MTKFSQILPNLRRIPQLSDLSPYAVITTAIRLRYDYDPTTMHRARLLPFDASEQWTCQSFVVVV